ncbi:response regulator [Streptomyces solincola]|uniref:Response regulator n=1 Tax=Streptomyces solincola TaxID=2100817 RepID=A0A2S9Q1H5_9ACTN|nr:response regulator [Streptomyces solincola]PRH80524.1 response regulator [Streptomyces solincola]
MPGIHFSLRLGEEEMAVLAADSVGDLAGRLILRAFDPLPAGGEHGRARTDALAHLHMLFHLKAAIERLEEEAAQRAADAGAGYPQIGRASGMTRQGARNRWPGLIGQPTTRKTTLPEPEMMTAPARPYDVLLVEDDVADAMLIQDALADRGARNLTQVDDGLAALEYLRDPDSTRPDLIVLDLNMPRMNGRELLAVLKGDENLRTIPVVVLTTSAAPDDVTGAYRQHANAYVTKPVNLEDFERAVRSIDAFYLDTTTKLPRQK